MFTRDQLYSSMGQMKSRSLFVETAQPGDEPFLSLSSNPKEGYVNLRNLFIRFVVNDPTEVQFAETVFGDLKYWENIKKSNWFQDYYKDWCFVADAKRKELAFQAIINEVQTNGKSAFSAAKYLIEEPWKGRTKQVQETKKKTTQLAVDSVSGDVIRLKEAGLLK